MIHGHHIDGIVDIRNEAQLDASLDKTPNKVIRVGYWCKLGTLEVMQDLTKIYLPADCESPTTYPGRTMRPFNPLFAASVSNFSETHLV